ncbi:MAG: MoaA/NifB/PqqE/SkfB family radical SAM enzyme [Bacteroidia bacterium]|jgi:MoaA/NifB/PqqE/SkfB family radical SAM enzyme
MLVERMKGLNRALMPQRLLYSPQWLVLGVNNICNLHCKMCDVGTKTNETNFAVNLVGTTPLHMPMDLFKQICDQAAQYFPKTKLGYAFTEPLVYKHLQESLAYAKSKNLYTAVTTNALNLRKEADQMIENGVGDIFISLDGPEEIHNEIRGHKSSFQRAMEGMEVVWSSKNPVNISVYCVITEWNYSNLKEFADFFKDKPIRELGFMHTNFTPQHVADDHNLQFGNKYPATCSNVEECDVSKIDLDVLWKEMEAIQKADYPFNVVFSPKVESRERLGTFYEEPEKLFGKKCNDVFSNIMIKSDGSVIPAHGRCYNLTVGNLYSESLKDVWNSMTLADFRKDLNKNGGLLPACSRCCSAFG